MPPDAKPFQFIGYSELRAYVEGTLPQAAAIKEIQQATRQFAKRQITWFRKENHVEWLTGFGDDPAIRSSALEIARSSTPQLDL